jgi:hypothetical protein
MLASFIMFVSDLVLFYQQKDQMHPAIPLTFDLLGWVGLFVIAVFAAMFAYPYAEYGEYETETQFMTHGERFGVACAFIAA